MIKWLIGILMVFYSGSSVIGQMQSASLDDQGHLIITPIEGYFQQHHRGQTITVKEGFPLSFRAPQLKNFRNVTLHDLDGDGTDEILFGVLDRFYCYSGSTLLWSRPVSAIIRYPCAVGDIDNDGTDEIVVLSGYSNEPGAVYIYRADGSDYPGWPLDFGGFTKLSSPALADLDNDQDLEIIFGDLNGSGGALHAVHHDGSYLNSEWPVDLPNLPAVTPSVGDLDRDGIKDIVVVTTREIYGINSSGVPLTGWPVQFPDSKFSYQSPILADIDSDDELEVIGTAHGDNPLFYALNADGSDVLGWPIPVPGGTWSFHSPSVVQYQGQHLIINARPNTGSDAVIDMLYLRKPTGRLLPGYPIVQGSGHQGVSTIADIDGDEDPDLIVSSNWLTQNGEGFIFAYDLLTGLLLPGFPILQKGWTLMNGATFGDIDGNGKLDMVALSYSDRSTNSSDSTFIYAYEMDAPVANAWWPTYKGSNTRDGLYGQPVTTSATEETIATEISISPNPSPGKFSIQPALQGQVTIMSLSGEVVHRQIGVHFLDLGHLPSGTYFIQCQVTEGFPLVKKVVILGN